MELRVNTVVLFIQIAGSCLVSVLFRDAFSHPYISFFHLLVNGFSVIIIILKMQQIVRIFLQWCGSVAKSGKSKLKFSC